ncbi:MAG: hypothetical protein KDB36_19640, partial [Acidimicrobiales bacterium]|nr:hypothetical protein [Acidimicrobiales bacterium]
IAGPLNVIDTAVTGNDAAIAGGILSLGAQATIARSSITTNTARVMGGGIGIGLATADIDATTISTNTAPTGAGIYATGDDRPATVDITDATITNNSGTGLETGTNTTAELTNTIIADQTTGPDCTQTAGGLTSQGTNLDSDGTCALTHATDLTADPILSDLTSTGARAGHTPLTGSPAIDTGANCNPTDQRHVARPQQGTCDRGAVEARIEFLPFGSPRNYLGTNQALSGTWRENFALSIADKCTAKEHGDRLAAVSDWNYSASSSGAGTFEGCTPGSPSAVRPNDEHNADGYTYVVEMPKTFVGTADLRIDAQGLAHCSNKNPTDDSWIGGSSYPMPTTVTVRRDDGTDGPTSGSVLFGPLTVTSFTNGGYYCGTTNSTVMNGGNSTWRALAAIPNAAAGDRFFIQIASNGTQTNNPGGNNQFSLRARMGETFTACTTDPGDINSTTQCPNVYALDHLGSYMNAPSAGAVFQVASLGPEHSGKLVDLFLWDPGEGANWLELWDPSGNRVPVTVEVACHDGTFPSETGAGCSSETSPAGGYGPFATNQVNLGDNYNFCSNRPSPRVTSCRKYNDRLLRITAQLPENITTAYGGRTWWKLYIRSATSSVTDRTTMQVAVRDPAAVVDE